MNRYDYIIVGAGSAGCVLANRLSEDPTVKVLLMEAGGKNDAFLIRMPAGSGVLVPKANRHNWGFWTEPEPHLDGRRMWWPRGRGWGGTSAINGMVYVRGHPSDYDALAEAGLRGWSYAEVLPYFKRLETAVGRTSPYRGDAGPLRISQSTTPSPLWSAFIAAGAEAGYPVNDDFNSGEQEGFGRFDLTLNDGARWSTSRAFLDPILAERKNLTAMVNAQTTRLLIEGGRVVGVEFVRGRGGAVERAYCDGEVILSAGAVQSPQILQLSGIGRPDDLRAAGVDVVHALNGVGGNLQDHLALLPSWRTPGVKTAYSYATGLKRLLTGAHYLFSGGGMGRSNFIEAGAFLRTEPGLKAPDIQLHCLLTMLGEVPGQIAGDGFTLSICPLRPESRGHVKLRSSDPFDTPSITANYLATEGDRQNLVRGFRRIREVVAQPSLSKLIVAENWPGDGVQTDAEIEAWARRGARTIYHPVGTCSMGREGDPDAVVDDRLKLIGLEGLRVVDASVMPALPGGNTSAPAIMIAEKASDMIRGRAPLPVEQLECVA